MSNASCIWREEEIADYMLGRMAEEKRRQLQLHLASCTRCTELRREWSAILQPEEAMSMPTPSPTLKRRLMRRIAYERWFSRRKKKIEAAFAVRRTAVLFLCLMSLFFFQRDSGPSDERTLAAHLPNMGIVMDPHTVLHVASVAPSHAKSYVWVNNTSNEMLILTKGLAPLPETDYQVWFITQDRRSRVGLLRWENGIAQLYFQGGELGLVENIAVSVEPKGGSFTPTSPDAIFVNLRTR